MSQNPTLAAPYGVITAPAAGRASLLRALAATEASYTQAALRLVLAVVIFPHGAQHLLGWFGGHGFARTFQWMTEVVGAPAPLAALAIVTEFFAPLALVAGAVITP